MSTQLSATSACIMKSSGRVRRKGAPIRCMNLSPWLPHLASWRRFLQAAGRPDTTIRTRLGQATHMARHVGVTPEQCTLDDLLDYSAAQVWAPDTRHGAHMALRSFGAHLVKQGVWVENLALHLPAVRPAAPLPRPTPESVVRQAVGEASARELLMLMFAFLMGMRRTEISKVHTDDVFEGVGGWLLLVHGKGDKERLLPMPQEIAVIVLAMPRGWVFPSPHPAHDHLTPGHVGKLISRALAGSWTAHTLRHRFATVIYGKCKDLLAVQELLGHQSPSTTKRYVRVVPDHLRSAMQLAKL